MPLAAFLTRIALIIGAVAFAASGCGFPHYEFPVGNKADASADTGTPAPDASPDPAPDAGPDVAPEARECSSTSDCRNSAGGSICDLEAGRCVQCIPGQKNCPWGLFCDPNGKCSSGCFSTEDCTPPDAGSSGPATGDPEAGAPHPLTCMSSKCWGCAADADCPPSSYCEPQSHLCLPGCSAFHACAVGYLCCDGTCIGGSESCGGCPGGFADCNKMLGDGCETPLNTLDNCGGCGTKCQFAHQATNCDTGSCVIGACIEPYTDCDKWQSTGCEVDKNTDRMNCGGCGNVCLNPHGPTPTCVDGTNNSRGMVPMAARIRVSVTPLGRN